MILLFSNLELFIGGIFIGLIILIAIVLYIKKQKIISESIKIHKESERLSKLEEEEKDKPYEDFTSGHLY